MSISNQRTFLSYVPNMKLSPFGCMDMLEIHLAPDLYLLTIDCFWRLYWNTVVYVAAKKCGFVGWKAMQWMMPLVVENGFIEDPLLMEWIRTYEVD